MFFSPSGFLGEILWIFIFCWLLGLQILSPCFGGFSVCFSLHGASQCSFAPLVHRKYKKDSWGPAGWLRLLERPAPRRKAHNTSMAQGAVSYTSRLRNTPLNRSGGREGEMAEEGGKEKEKTGGKSLRKNCLQNRYRQDNQKRQEIKYEKSRIILHSDFFIVF